MNDDVVSFIAACNNIEYTVKKAFMRRFLGSDSPSNYVSYDLNVRFGISSYLHNPLGPAVKILDSRTFQYWMNGKLLTPEQYKSVTFNIKLLDILED